MHLRAILEKHDLVLPSLLACNIRFWWIKDAGGFASKAQRAHFIPLCIGMQLLKVSVGLQVVVPVPLRPSWRVSVDFSFGHQH